MHFPSGSVDPRDEMAHLLDLCEIVNAAFAASSIDRGDINDTAPLPEAIDEVLALNPTVEGASGPFLIPPVDSNNPATPPPEPCQIPSDGPVLQRDREVLLEIARYRLVSFAHLKEFLFSNRHSSVLTRRMQALERSGFITTWDEYLARGGHPRFALLTQRGLSWAMEALRAAAVGHPHEQLVGLMLRTRTRKPLILAPRTAPPFLPHQVETNRLAATLARTAALGITWASTWHRPFPNEARGVAMPQPDAVLVSVAGGRPQLFFLEHDRTQESSGSFAERKTQRYQLLLDLGLARELLGFDSFTVLVTVIDPVTHRPFERIRALQEVSAAAPMMRFAPAGWVNAAPDAAVWFTPGTLIQTMSLKPRDHSGLVPLFSNLGR
jgi:hypothetical protein